VTSFLEIKVCGFLGNDQDLGENTCSLQPALKSTAPSLEDRAIQVTDRNEFFHIKWFRSLVIFCDQYLLYCKLGYSLADE